MKTVALLTDFGETDSFVGMMKGALLKAVPDLTIIDVTHQIASFDIRTAAFILERSIKHYPVGTVFIVVIDPGVGSDRRILAASAGGYSFVAPDNGVLSFVLRGCEDRRLVAIEHSELLPANPGKTFHGRDIMAPAAAQLACGRRLEELGNPLGTYQVLPIPNLLKHESHVIGEVMYVDKFGNMITNITKDDLPKGAEIDKLRVTVGNSVTTRFAESYSAANGLSAIISGFDTVELFINQGSAAAQFSQPLGTPVAVAIE